jgi:hypothetical protein
MTGPGERLRHLSGRGLHEGLTEGAEKILAAARKNAPVGTPPEDDSPGQLRASGEVVQERHAILVAFNVPYAAKQELALHYHHSQGSARYLEKAIQEVGPELEQLVASKVRHLTQGTRAF